MSLKLKMISRLIFVILMIGIFPCSFAKSAEVAGVPLRGFSDVDFTARSTGANNFFHGAIDFFLTKSLDKRVNFLLELNFEKQDSGSIAVDAERIYLQYVFSNWLKVSGGRFHTGLGYWNETYHHGAYLYTSVSRPQMLSFEDDGGILPVHTTGLEFRGNGNVGSGTLGYIVNVGNGRGPDITKDPQVLRDANKSKAAGGVAYYEFDNGVRLGANLYVDELPGTDPPAPPRNAGGEFIWGAHFIYNSPLIEWLTEFDDIYHRFRTGEQSTATAAFYSHLGVHIGLFTPYVRYDLVRPSVGDSYLNLPDRIMNYVAGTRYELSNASALKLEYFYQTRSSATHTWNTTAQWAFNW